ncbi:MAG: DUF4129 domain-containing protein [Deltaproteobacteria bacterium]|nr:DUF4129 domain-containing protein [Deltaproteobacteria bacterium]
MRGLQNNFLIIICGGMLLSWVYTWAAFIMPALGSQPFSLPDGALILALATVITMLHRGRGWRTASIIGIQVAGFTFAVLRMVYVHFEWSHSFWSRDWIIKFLSQQHSPMEWVLIVLILFWAAALWISGIKLVHRDPDRFTISSRFDIGAAAFLFLLLFRLTMMVKGATISHGGNSELAFLAFFVFGLLGLGIARYGDTGEKAYISTYGGIGVVLSFVILVLLFGGGLVILFLPSLMSAAEIGNDLLKAVARPVVPVVITVLRLLLVKGCRLAPEKYDPSSPQDAGPKFSAPSGSEGGLLQDILTWSFLVLLGVLAMIILVTAAYYLIRWLASRRPVDKNKLSIWQVVLQWISLFKVLLLSFLARVMRKTQRHQGAGYQYALLLRWGSHCGLPRTPNETPLEYGSRLAQQFPGLRNEIILIVDLFNQTVYGVIDPEAEQLTTARLAWYRLRSPLLWPVRLKTWFLSPAV